MKYKNRRYRYVFDFIDMCKIISIAHQFTYFINIKKSVYEFKPKCAELRKASYVKAGDRYFEITTMYVKDIVGPNKIEYEYTDEKYACTWIFDKTQANDITVAPGVVARASARIYKPYEEINIDNSVFDIVKNKVVQSARPILGYNKMYDNTEHKVYVYDLNSAYANILKDKIIDTYHWRNYCKVGENEIGFLMDDDLTLVYPGNYADRVYPLIDSPFKEYVTKYYNIKRRAPKGSRERSEAKAYLNYLVGCWQNHNPFLRAYVVNSCNKIINDLLKKYGNKICMWNTDAIYSVEPLDLEIGNEIGQFKIEYEGLFRQKGNTYQKVDKEEVCFRGISKCLFKKGYNILTDPLPKHFFPIEYDTEKEVLYENSLFKEKQ